MKVALVFPPLFDPSMPYLAPYSLATYLRNSVHECAADVYDLNIRLFNDIVPNPYRDYGHPTSIRNAYRGIIQCERRIDNGLSEWSRLCGIKVSRQNMVLPIDVADADSIFEYVKGESVFKNVLAKLLHANINVECYDVIGFVVSVYEQFVPSMILAQEAKAVSTSIVTVCGGNIISRLYESIVATGASRYYDYIVRREGELPMAKLLYLLQGIEKDIKTNDLLNGDNGNPIKPVRQEDVIDMATLPLTEFDDIEMDNYFSPLRVLPVSMSRGCSWGRCIYCGIHSGWCAKYRARPVEAVTAELKSNIRKYNVKAYRLVDEGPSTADIMRLAKSIKEAELDVRIEAYANVGRKWTSDERAKTLYEAGFRQLFLGIESVDKKLLKEMNKEINDPAIYEEVLDCLYRNGLMNYGFFITGLPGGAEDINAKTERFIIKTKSLNTVAVASFIPISNSPIYKDVDYKKHYGVEFELLGDLTTRCEMMIGGIRVTDSINQETEEMVKRIFEKRRDLWLTSNIPYEARFYMCTKYGNEFGFKLAMDSGMAMDELVLSGEMMLRARGLRNGE